MTSIPNGYTFQFNADGTQIIAGYQVCRHINLVTGQETEWPLNGDGEWYPCGWNNPGMPCVFTPTQASPPMTHAYDWHVPTGHYTGIAPDAEAIGHAGLALFDGETLSTNGSVIWHNGAVITPEAFNGPVWDDPHAYGYKRGWDGSGPFVVRSLPDNLIVTEINSGGMYERPYSLSGGVWVTGQYPGGSRVYPPMAISAPWPLPERELAGPMLERGGVAYVITAVMGAGNNPRGVMVRPWSEVTSGGLLGWYIDGLRHQCLQARVNPAGEIVVGGCEFPGSGLITIEAIPLDRPMGLVPPEVVIPDPPKPPDPPVVPQPSPVILVSTEAGVAPLLVGATAHYLPVDKPVSFLSQIDGEVAWAIEGTVPVGTAPAYTYRFPFAGTFHVSATSGSGKNTDIRTVTVSAPPPPEPPKPPKRPWWWVLLFAKDEDEVILRLIREPSHGGATLGALYVDGVWQCWTLEDQIREVAGVPVEAWKVKGATAIPAGRYDVRITQSARFGRALPLLENVEGFVGIRIHPGNAAADTEGCILCGAQREVGRITQSQLACEAVQRKIADALAKSESVSIQIENPVS